MSRKAAFSVIGCVILLLVGPQWVLASDHSGRLRLGGFVGMAMCEQEDLNGTMEDLEDFWSAWEVDWDDSELRGALQAGVHAEYLINGNWLVGAEYLRLSGTGGYDWYVETEASGTSDVEADYGATGNLVSVYGAYRLPLGGSPVALRIGGGVGYLFAGGFEWDLNAYQEDVPMADSVLVSQYHLKATGSTVAFHGVFGADYELADNLLVSANIAYRVASIDELEVSDSRATVNGVSGEVSEIEEGEPLRWYYREAAAHFSTEEGDKVGLDFSGLYFTLSVAYVF